ncbi:OLC1v1014205C1 [Oldenlandia corymbosa var. corymbosa]|uniref:Kinesin-like protein n=2 Tax=Oldenlandia corymbosa var. corymbosa TaxID=529605 RepID=A0AAV1E0H3_OLDCO|nr:OLC1v1014205C1 [Oldenlandia corymbosa var. corymbosa]
MVVVNMCLLQYGGPFQSSDLRSENVKRFLTAMENMGLPTFQLSDLEVGSMKNVLECLLTLRSDFLSTSGDLQRSDSISQFGGEVHTRWKILGDCFKKKNNAHKDEANQGHSSFQRALRSPVMGEPSTALMQHVGHKFHEVFQLKNGRYADLPASKISEMMKSNSLDNAPTQSLLSVVNGILDESVERKNGEIPQRVALLLRKVVQEIERRISTQADHLKTQSNMFKAREEKYQSRIQVLEALAHAMSDDSENSTKEQQEQHHKAKIEDRRKAEEQDAAKVTPAKEDHSQEIADLKQELETARKAHEQRCLQMETEARAAQQVLQERLNEVEKLLTVSKSRVRDLEASSEQKSKGWNKKEHIYQIFTEFQLGALRELKFSTQSIKQEIVKTQKGYSEEFNTLGTRIKALQNAAESYYSLLSENQKLHNELQEFKGNIRVYCRVRPFITGQKESQTIVEYVGENGELIVVNPAKQGKESRRLFKFNKVYDQSATQVQVYSDTQPLIQSVLDGYSVCIFAYGQTGSGKTYTMTGPDRATEEEWGVNYRALNNLFAISQSRESTFHYDISVQMVEIYNEQVRDLLAADGSQKRLGILSTAKQNGLAVPDASMYPVRATSDVMHLMDVGLKNRAKGSTALNERSSRSHSIVSIHVRGVDQKTGSTMQSSLHLVDLAGSERVDRSEVTGDRLKEAQHINKSLSALGDVISALAQKSSHVPYRNSKLTQVLQSSLGGNAKTLMFVQLNPESNSYSESLSTLKFAERVSGVELGAAKSSKDGRDVRELMEQVASLKDAIAKKDEEIERLQLNMHHGGSADSSRYGPSSPRTPQRSMKLSSSSGGGEKAASDVEEENSESSDNHSDSVDSFRSQKDSLQQSKTTAGTGGIIETDGSPGSGHIRDKPKRPEITEKIRTTSRSPRTPDMSPRASPKISTGIRRSPSTTSLQPRPTPTWR